MNTDDVRPLDGACALRAQASCESEPLTASADALISRAHHVSQVHYLCQWISLNYTTCPCTALIFLPVASLQILLVLLTYCNIQYKSNIRMATQRKVFKPLNNARHGSENPMHKLTASSLNTSSLTLNHLESIFTQKSTAKKVQRTILSLKFFFPKKWNS